MRVLGVDGCPGGWLAVELHEAGFERRFHSSFSDLVLSYPNVSCIAVDIPIGLTSSGPRGCDVAARKLLGSIRGTSVFPAPDPRLLDSANHAIASARSRTLTGGGISIQSFGIFPKVAEVDGLMTPLLQNWIVEVHPEVSFWALAGGRPLFSKKGRLEGFEERRGLLAQSLGIEIPDRRAAANPVRPCRADDVLTRSRRSGPRGG